VPAFIHKNIRRLEQRKLKLWRKILAVYNGHVYRRTPKCLDLLEQTRSEGERNMILQEPPLWNLSFLGLFRSSRLSGHGIRV
jgi:hypothetical protein